MLDFGWKKKVDRLRMTMLSVGHFLAKELPVELQRVLMVFRGVATTGDGSPVLDELERNVPEPEPEDRPTWEPIEISGWLINVTMYLDGNQLWWLLHAARPNERSPSEKDAAFLDKVLDQLGADPRRDMIIGPRSHPDGEAHLPFGWWAWFNRDDLYEMQARGRGKAAQIRIVPLGSRESEGYVRVPMTKEASS